MRGRNIKDVKESNKALLYECVRRNGRITLAALMEITNLSRPTVTGLIRELEDENLIIQIGFDNSNVGRAPTLYGINPNIAYAIGVDFDYPFSRISICDLSGSKIPEASGRRYQDVRYEAVNAKEEQACLITSIFPRNTATLLA